MLTQISTWMRDFTSQNTAIAEDETKSAQERLENLKRALEIVYTKLNLYRLMKPGTSLFKEEIMC